MIAILAGLGAALAFAVTTLCSSRSSRMIGSGSLLAGVMLVGLSIAGPAVLAEGVPARLGAGALGWLAVSGLGNVGGLLLSYSALRVGKLGIVVPITSTEGAIAALISLAAGERIAPGAGVALAVVASGVVLAGMGRSPDPEPSQRRDGRAALLAIGAAVSFGASLYATGRVSTELPLVWALLPARLVGVVVVALPLLVSSRLRLTRRALPLVVAGGFCEVAGFALFVIGARHGLAVSAVLASQFAAISAVAAFGLFHERLAPAQVAGVAAIVAGVAALTALQS